MKYSVGSHNNCCLTNEEDLKNIVLLANILSVCIIIVDIFETNSALMYGMNKEGKHGDEITENTLDAVLIIDDAQDLRRDAQYLHRDAQILNKHNVSVVHHDASILIYDTLQCNEHNSHILASDDGGVV